VSKRTALLLFALVAAGAAFGQTSYPYVITTLAGSNPVGDGGPAKSALLEFPVAVAVDSSGNVYLADQNGPEIRKVTRDGTINMLVSVDDPLSVQVDAAGNVYFGSSSAVYKVSPAGKMTTIAGGSWGFGGDEGPATGALLTYPSGLALDGAGNIYIADTNNCRVRKITPDGRIHTIAGNGTCATAGDRGLASSAELNYPSSVAVDSSGNIYVAEQYRIRLIAAGTGIITSFAGGSGSFTADGIQATTAYIPSSLSLAVDRSGNLYFTDYTSSRVRMIGASNGIVKTVAGTGTAGFGGDGGAPTSALLNYPIGVAVDSTGNIYIADQNNCRIRMVDTSGHITTVAGATHYAGDQTLATGALLHYPQHAIKDPRGNLYISDMYNHAIRKVAPSGIITTIAGNGTCGYTGDQGPAVSATLCYPEALALDSNGNLYVADSSNHVVRRIDTGGQIATYAGTGTSGDAYHGSQAAAAQLRCPAGLAADGAGNLYVSDECSNRVHKIAANGTISLVAGTGAYGYLGDGGPATAAQMRDPFHLALDGSGNKLYIADLDNKVVRKVESGIITTVAGTPTCCGPGQDATHTYFGNPGGIAVDSLGSLYISEPTYFHVAKVSGDTIATIAGNGNGTFAGDGGLATSGSVNAPWGLWVDATGDVYVADVKNNRIRKLTLDSPAGLAIAAGDQQKGTVGTTLKALVVNVGFRGQIPLAGIPVTFAVTSGAATLTASTANTDVTGAASVGITLGSTPGAVVVAASLNGLLAVQFNLTANAAVPLPAISSDGIAGAGASVPPVAQISPGGLASIYGSNFAPAGTSRQVYGGDLVNGSLPTQLAGVCVQVGGLPAFITYVGAGQINIQVPAVPVNSAVDVQVTSNCGAANALQSATQKVATAAAAPELLYWLHNANGRNPVCAVDAVTLADIGTTGLISGLTFTPAKPGEILTIYGISFGPANPAVAPGALAAGAASTTNNPVVTVGSVTLDSSDVLYAGVSPGSAGLYQLNIRVPANLADGDYPVTLSLGSFTTPAGGYLTVKN
jgi:trimeric autotransporter adhesin